MKLRQSVDDMFLNVVSSKSTLLSEHFYQVSANAATVQAA